MSENRLAVVTIIVEDRAAAPKVNACLSDFSEYAVGRMGIPYRERDLSVICFVVDAPMELINSLSGKLGMIGGVKAKTVTSRQ